MSEISLQLYYIMFTKFLVFDIKNNYILYTLNGQKKKMKFYCFS